MNLGSEPFDGVVLEEFVAAILHRIHINFILRKILSNPFLHRFAFSSLLPLFLTVCAKQMQQLDWSGLSDEECDDVILPQTSRHNSKNPRISDSNRNEARRLRLSGNKYVECV